MLSTKFMFSLQFYVLFPYMHNLERMCRILWVFMFLCICLHVYPRLASLFARLFFLFFFVVAILQLNVKIFDGWMLLSKKHSKHLATFFFHFPKQIQRNGKKWNSDESSWEKKESSPNMSWVELNAFSLHSLIQQTVNIHIIRKQQLHRKM